MPGRAVETWGVFVDPSLVLVDQIWLDAQAFPFFCFYYVVKMFHFSRRLLSCCVFGAYDNSEVVEGVSPTRAYVHRRCGDRLQELCRFQLAACAGCFGLSQRLPGLHADAGL